MLCTSCCAPSTAPRLHGRTLLHLKSVTEIHLMHPAANSTAAAATAAPETATAPALQQLLRAPQAQTHGRCSLLAGSRAQGGLERGAAR
mmetsp:Transcript_20406/g.56869  ORF Transcript_20406/g.56869 Transcript_20406/m.56869 type:complete len:89 (+) Transcript_20406:1138-1404(+)|eukprot:1128963-Pelagomonas_calceolata.AAC.2